MSERDFVKNKPLIKINNHKKNFFKGNYLTSVYDVTVAYPCKEIVQNEAEMLFRGKLSSQVHYAIRRFDQNELPKMDEELHEWLLK
ncbi:unnamed protein product [Meloidogyne enterolobii]|uniref:Uncharacterized protein n=1 Tax=Meloidogyne enterolobii TaxID=390850 RepID=A0ACB0YKL5_MELEN